MRGVLMPVLADLERPHRVDFDLRFQGRRVVLGARGIGHRGPAASGALSAGTEMLVAVADHLQEQVLPKPRARGARVARNARAIPIQHRRGISIPRPGGSARVIDDS